MPKLTVRRAEQLEALLRRLRRAVFAEDEAQAERVAALIPAVQTRLAPLWALQAAERRVQRDAEFRFRWE